VRITASDLLRGKVKVSETFAKDLEKLATGNLLKNTAFMASYEKAFGMRFTAADMMYLLVGVDVLKDIQAGVVKEKDIPQTQQTAADFVRGLSGDAADVVLYAYGLMQRRFNYDYNIISDLKNHPWILGDIQKKLNEKGYKTFAEYVNREFTAFYRMMGLLSLLRRMRRIVRMISHRTRSAACRVLKYSPGPVSIRWSGCAERRSRSKALISTISWMEIRRYSGF
jgi:hypothetical protein